jgi:hypothetical protein
MVTWRYAEEVFICGGECLNKVASIASDDKFANEKASAVKRVGVVAAAVIHSRV